MEARTARGRAADSRSAAAVAPPVTMHRRGRAHVRRTPARLTRRVPMGRHAKSVGDRSHRRNATMRMLKATGMIPGADRRKKAGSGTFLSATLLAATPLVLLHRQTGSRLT